MYGELISSICCTYLTKILHHVWSYLWCVKITYLRHLHESHPPFKNDSNSVFSNSWIVTGSHNWRWMPAAGWNFWDWVLPCFATFSCRIRWYQVLLFYCYWLSLGICLTGLICYYLLNFGRNKKEKEILAIQQVNLVNQPFLLFLILSLIFLY